jgi:cyclic pyranopterin phosphate synthase
LQNATIKLIEDNNMKKGDVLTIAEIAGIMGGKKTSELIPLCHPLMISKIDVKTTISQTGIIVIASAKCTGQTGIEMEALTAVSIALLTIYDMCKAVDKEMVIEEITLLEKTKE